MAVGIEFSHACSFCGWARASATPVMLSPRCERCGCALDARVSDRSGAVAQALPMHPLAALALRRSALVLGALALYAAGEVGYHAAGVAGGMTALGVGGFLMLPFVPESLDGPRRR
jgi:hypothetical protein